MTGRRALPARLAYRLWAPSYEAENPVSLLEDAVVARLCPDVTGRRLLDAGCGTGRRLDNALARRARTAIGIDLVSEMLARGRQRLARGAHLAAADVHALPFGAATFDLVWCRLVAGHLPDLEDLYRELARVTRAPGCVVMTDFHPEAARAGHVRTFRDPAGELRLVEHHVHQLEDHAAAAARAGWRLDASLDGRVGPLVQEFYDRSGASERFLQQCGLPLVLGLRFLR